MKLDHLLWRFSSVLLLVSCSYSYNVLILHPVFTGSHEVILRMIGEKLTELGHSVTQIRWENEWTQPVNSSVEVITRRVNATDLDSPFFSSDGVFLVPYGMIWKRQRRVYNIPPNAFSITHGHCEDVLGDAKLFNQLKAANFSVAIVDLISNECGVALVSALNLPMVGYWAFTFVGGESHFMSTLNMPSVVAHFNTDLSPRMNFPQRLYNLMSMVLHRLYLWNQVRIANSYVKKYHPYLPEVGTLLHTLDSLLIFSNFHCTQPMLLPPNIKMMGCPQCKKAQPLTEEFERFMESSGDDGVVVFSLGITGYDVWSIPDPFIDSFLAAFRRLKQKVIMRFSKNRLKWKSVPPNVWVVDRIPQINLLGHKKTRAFVSHCGMNSVMESFYMGVPILGVPIFGDQGDNSAFLNFRELGIGLDKHNLNEEQIYTSLMKLIYSSNFRSRVRRIGSMWRKQTRPDMAAVLEWIDQVALRGRQSHLQIAEDHLSWSQYWALDVLATIFLLPLLVTLLTCLAIYRFQRIPHKRITK